MADLFTWEELAGGNEKTAPKKLVQAFKTAGAEIAASWVEAKQKRENSITYRTIVFALADNQQIALRVKQTGDIYQVRLNNKIVPIKNQDDVKAAMSEIVKIADANASKFQRALMRKKITLPRGLKSTVKRKEELLREREAELDRTIAEARTAVTELNNELASLA